MTQSALRLGLYYHVPSLRKAEGIYLPGFFGCFVDSLAAHCQQVICLLHEAEADQQKICDYRITAGNVSGVNLGLPGSSLRRTLLARPYIQQARPAFAQMDVLLLRGPSPLLPALAAAANKLPLVLLIVGDYLAGIDSAPQPRWRKELIRLWARWNERGQLRAAQHALTFVNSQKLYDELQGKVPDLRLTRTTTLSQADFYEREDTCQNHPVHLLYTGRLSVAKGLFDIVTALAKLVAQGEDVVLDLAGWPEPGEEGILEQLAAFADQQGAAGRVNYLGYKALGLELFACYQQADIYVIASRLSEGFPRTIWEAMAHSLPVVASRVGSIPAYVEGAAELFTPSQSDDLFAAIARLLHQPKLRSQRIRAGLVLARQNTLEVHTEKMMQNILEWFEKK